MGESEYAWIADSCTAWRSAHLNNFSNLVHGCKGKPTSSLTLSKVQHWYNATLFVVVGIFAENA